MTTPRQRSRKGYPTLQLNRSPRGMHPGPASNCVRVFRACGRVVLMEVQEDGSPGEEIAIPADRATPEYVAWRLERFERFVEQRQRSGPPCPELELIP